MSEFGKLFHFEVHRFRFVLFGLMAFTAIVQFGVLLWTVLNELAYRRSAAWRSGEAPSSWMFPGDAIAFADVISYTQRWFFIPILISIAVLLIYTFLIWYRDWFGRQTIVYRLLMLPVDRKAIYLAKWAAILTFVFSLVAFQAALLWLERWTFDRIVPQELWAPTHFADAIRANEAMQLLLPRNVDAFLFSYGLGALGVAVAFTAVLLERSYRPAGIAYAIVYAAGCFAAVVLPPAALGLGDPDSMLYPEEIWAATLAIWLLIGVGAVALGFRLLNKKVSV